MIVICKERLFLSLNVTKLVYRYDRISSEGINVQQGNSFSNSPLTTNQACKVGNYFLHNIFVEKKECTQANCLKFWYFV